MKRDLCHGNQPKGPCRHNTGRRQQQRMTEKELFHTIDSKPLEKVDTEQDGEYGLFPVGGRRGVGQGPRKIICRESMGERREICCEEREQSLRLARDLGWEDAPEVLKVNSTWDSLQWGIWMLKWPLPVDRQDSERKDKDSNPSQRQNVPCLKHVQGQR